ncbi:hypothetical protein GYMLUDRAFT_178922 [Collybiopsis luxurians FD-317 M1]|uniref:RBR-type E3 ubiquitin transferase n=1 Tax=Collybiopsis luxurians FD-317 M1 TaxID=944289 RepID=A0A0D0BFI8_9AGAR|nr:hypothetical protein GYMLUDRAFT_178922 [Collybiopsis luxurians FD-317 M1]
MASVETEPDTLTSLLIAQLTLDDISAITSTRKGKARDDSLLTDEQVAFRLFEQENLALVQTLKLARSLQDAIDSDTDVLSRLSAVDVGAVDDRRYAEALSLGQRLPEKTEAQRALETPLMFQFFSLTEDDSEEDSSNDFRLVPAAYLHPASFLPTLSQITPIIFLHSRVECVICGDRFRALSIFKATCEHHYCLDCLRELVQACLGDESLFPLRCCQQPLHVTSVLRLLSADIRRQFEAKSREFSTLPNHRVYCSNPTCSRFLGSSEVDDSLGRRDIHCSDCSTPTCKLCKQRSHPNGNCGENTALIELKALAEREHWQTCPRCSRIIELRYGCYHMTCLCRQEFCYLCAVPWKNCRCPQWEEGRLLDTAARRVEREWGAAVRQEQPMVFQRRVQTWADQLRDNHDCDPHRWLHRTGGGRCEECGDFLPLFLKECRRCHVMVCVRCMRNRM